MTKLKASYRVIRSIFFTAILTVASLYVILYVAISIPPVQKLIKDTAVRELSELLDTHLLIGSLSVVPFSELKLYDVEIYDRDGVKCLNADQIGAGIDIKQLIFHQKIEITYAELIGVSVKLYKNTSESPLNIDFIIKAFESKDKNKPPAKIDLKLRNIVVRKSALSFDKKWLVTKDPEVIDFNHLEICNLQADISVPMLKNDEWIVDCRRIAFSEKSGLTVNNIGFLAHITDHSASINRLKVELPSTLLTPADISLNFKSLKQLPAALYEGSHTFVIVDNTIDPRDFKAFFPPLGRVNLPLSVSLELVGNLNALAIDNLVVESQDRSLDVKLSSKVENPIHPEELHFEDTSLELKANKRLYTDLSQLDIEALAKAMEIMHRIGDINMNLKGRYAARSGDVSAVGYVESDAGNILVDCDGYFLSEKNFSGKLNLTADNLNPEIFDNSYGFGLISLSVEGEADCLDGDISGDIYVDVPSFFYKGERYESLNAHVEKTGNEYGVNVSLDNSGVSFDLSADGVISKTRKQADIMCRIDNIDLYKIGLTTRPSGHLSGSVAAEFEGTGINDMEGILSVDNLSFVDDNSKILTLNHLLISDYSDEEGKHILLDSDFLTLNVDGSFRYSDIVPTVRNLLAANIPSVVRMADANCEPVNLDYSLTLYSDDRPEKFFGIKYVPGSDVTIKGSIDTEKNEASMNLSAPYIVQNGNKVIKDTKVNLLLSSVEESRLKLSTDMPVKNGRGLMSADISSFNDFIRAAIGWDVRNDKAISGGLQLSARLEKNPLSSKPDVELSLLPSTINIKGGEWTVDRADVVYDGSRLDLSNIRLWHESQFVEINGTASSSADDIVKISLNDIDLNYIFDILNINYVTFGGIASGEVEGRALLSKTPEASTKRLFVKGLSYNGAVLGDGDLSSSWHNDSKMVSIRADIRDMVRPDVRRALVDGGIWVTRDSLSFDMKANKINARLLKPFMAAFADDFGGKASGDLKLYGTFKDIDMIGRAYADSIAIKIGFTNVEYHGSDSVYLDKGHIRIPSFRLYDTYGNSAIFSGDLYHNYFHDPTFEFRVKDARRLLCYDTNAQINPDWYGKIYGNGNASLSGRPGIVSMMLDMQTAPNSSFTFVLNDTQDAANYSFLTFSDNRRRLLEEQQRKSHIEEVKPANVTPERPTIFNMEIRGTVTPDAIMTLVMDPKAGDKITARGSGAMQIDYSTDNDDMKMYGKYTLEDGSYNFSLQDLILRDFAIKKGSTISFNGDPLQANLDITANYRVNTNLSDLDKSFLSDRDLNRTNVPVDAVLHVEGDMQNPNISFDIELPTLTQEVVRKVKSVISTDDMMNRQIIYLLALNRFYTPEYMGNTGNGGELASVASSTISSQLSNIMGQLTDKFTLAPSFRSDKGDFSDMEVDVALSSRLLNNRLLLNGNFGYRDKNTSMTTFVGDFDIEYLLSKSGALRLKAYNHFNDQNYYLKSALTTQGIGVIYRKDFDNPFTFLKRRKKDNKGNEKDNSNENDTTTNHLTDSLYNR